MSELEMLEMEIENLRKELNAVIVRDGISACYEISRKLDKLIEKHIEMCSG